MSDRPVRQVIHGKVYECDCTCHTKRDCLHFMPCCYQCPGCKVMVRTNQTLDHRSQCDAYKKLEVK